MTTSGAPSSQRLLRRGLALEYVTLSWNAVGVVLLALAAFLACSPTLADFGCDSLIEIVASTVVVWELTGNRGGRERRTMRIIGLAFVALVVYLVVQVVVVLIAGSRPQHSVLGIVGTAATFVVMLALSGGKAGPGQRWAPRCCRPRAGSPWLTLTWPGRICWGWC